MWIKIKKEWMKNPKGTIINLNEMIAIRLVGSKQAEACDPPEKNPQKSVYFPQVDAVDPGEVLMVNDINNMGRDNLIQFIEENDLDVEQKFLVNPDETDKTKWVYQTKLLSNLRAEAAAKAATAGLGYEVEKSNRGENKMMEASPVEK